MVCKLLKWKKYWKGSVVCVHLPTEREGAKQ